MKLTSDLIYYTKAVRILVKHIEIFRIDDRELLIALARYNSKRNYRCHNLDPLYYKEP